MRVSLKKVWGVLFAAALTSCACGSTVTTGSQAAQQILVNSDYLDRMSFENGTLTLYVTHNHNTVAVVKALAALAIAGGGLWGAASLAESEPGLCVKGCAMNVIPHKAKLMGIAFVTGAISAYLASSAYHDATTQKERIPYIMLDAHGLTRCDGWYLAWSDFEYSDAVGNTENCPIFVKGSNLTLESFYDTGVQLPIPFKQFRLIAAQYLAANKVVLC